MMRLLGAALLILGTGSLGLGSALTLRREARTLRQLASAFHHMAGEIALGHAPLPELLQKLRVQSVGTAKQLFRRAAELVNTRGDERFDAIWRQAVEDTPIPREGKVLICEAGAWLGQMDAARQEAALTRLGERLGVLGAETEERARQEGRVRTAIGFGAGICMAVLLL